jgi:putative membrane protein
VSGSQVQVQTFTTKWVPYSSHSCFWVLMSAISTHAGLLLVVGATMQDGILAALLVFSSRAFSAHGGATTLWGLDPLSAQALAGVIMWVPGGIVYLITAATLFARWLDRDTASDQEAMVYAP